MKNTKTILLVVIAITLLCGCNSRSSDTTGNGNANQSPIQNAGVSSQSDNRQISPSWFVEKLRESGYITESELDSQNLSSDERVAFLQRNNIVGVLVSDDDISPHDFNGCRQVIYYNYFQYMNNYTMAGGSEADFIALLCFSDAMSAEKVFSQMSDNAGVSPEVRKNNAQKIYLEEDNEAICVFMEKQYIILITGEKTTVSFFENALGL